MSIEIEMPYESLPVSGSMCKHFAVHNPIEINVQRKDFSCTSSDDSGQTKLTGSGFPSLGTGYVYVNAGTVIGVYQVLSNDGTTIHIDRPFTVNDTGASGYVNLNSYYPNYFVETKLDRHEPIDSVSDLSSIPFQTIRTRPDNTGMAVIDVAPFVRDRVICENEFDYTSGEGAEALDENLCAQFLVSHREYFNTSELYSEYSDLEWIYVYNSAMQAGHSSCMTEYMAEPTGQDRAKFLTVSPKLRWWSGYPLSLEVIIGEDLSQAFLTGTELRKYETVKTGSSIDSQNYIGFAGGYAGIQRLRFYADYTDPSDNMDVQIRNQSALNLSESINIRLIHCIPKNPIYLCWIDYTGGWRCFMFGCNQVRGLKVSSGGLFTNRRESDFRNSVRFSDLIPLIHDQEYLSKDAIPEMTLGTDKLDQYDILLIESLLSSPKVLMLINPDTWADSDSYSNVTPAWETVRIDVGSYKINDTKRDNAKCQFKMFLPALNTQTQ